MPRPSERVTRFEESVIRGMTRLAVRHDAINLSQGFPDADPPEALLAAAERAARHGPHQYAVTWGAADFRAALAEKQSRLMGLPLDPDRHIVVTCGSTEAMMAAMMTACNPGDKIIVFSPYYENYVADAILSGALPIDVPLRPPHFRVDPAELRRAIEQPPHAHGLCNPSNPTGRVFTPAELAAIAALAEEFDTFVITDEVYEHIVYAPHRHTYFASLPGMFKRTLSCSSLSKTYAITGWRLGYVIAPPELTDGARKVHDFLTVGAAAPLQRAAVTALRFGPEYYDGLRADYTRKRDLFLSLLDAAGLTFTRPEGAYFVMVDLESLGVRDDTRFCEWLIREVGVAAVPGSSFSKTPGLPPFIRFHFAKNEDTLLQAGARLATLRDKLTKSPSARA
jgi:aminotransferase